MAKISYIHINNLFMLPKPTFLDKGGKVPYINLVQSENVRLRSMRKEIIVAVVVGIGVGVAIAFGIWRANSALTTSKSPIIPQLFSEEAPQEISEELKVIFSQPEQNEVSVENP